MRLSEGALGGCGASQLQAAYQYLQKAKQWPGVQAILHDGLYQSFRHLQETASRKTFATTFSPAAKALAWLGLGAAGSQIVGSPISAGKGTGSAVIQALQERAKSKAIWTVVSSFTDAEPWEREMP